MVTDIVPQRIKKIIKWEWCGRYLNETAEELPVQLLFFKRNHILFDPFYFPLNTIICQKKNFKFCSGEIFKNINFLVLEIKFYSFLTMPKLLSQLKPSSVLQVLVAMQSLWEMSINSVLKIKLQIISFHFKNTSLMQLLYRQ